MDRDQFLAEHLAVTEADEHAAGLYFLDDEDVAAWDSRGALPVHPDPQVVVEPVPWNLGGRLCVRWHVRPA
jgi:hypothetical protein